MHIKFEYFVINYLICWYGNESESCFGGIFRIFSTINLFKVFEPTLKLITNEIITVIKIIGMTSLYKLTTEQYPKVIVPCIRYIQIEPNICGKWIALLCFQ